MIEVLHKDKDFIVCVKPQGIPSQSDTTGDEDMTSLLKESLKECGEKADIFVVHRLDRATGGLILYARNQTSASIFSRLVAEKDGFSKEYLALVSGTPNENSGNMTDYLFKDSAQKRHSLLRVSAKVQSLPHLTMRLLKQSI